MGMLHEHALGTEIVLEFIVSIKMPGHKLEGFRNLNSYSELHTLWYPCYAGTREALSYMENVVNNL